MKKFANRNTFEPGSSMSKVGAVKLRYRGISLTSDHDIEAEAPNSNTGQYYRMGKTSHSEILASYHTISTEAKTLHRKSQRFVEQAPTNLASVPRLSTRLCRKYSLNDIQKITERMVTPPTKSDCRCLDRSSGQLTRIERFGVPPHLWGRQKPADDRLIERLVKPTTSHSQRRALTLQQYKSRSC